MSTVEERVADQIASIQVQAVAMYQDRLFDFLTRWAKEMPATGGSTRAGVDWVAQIVAKSTDDPEILTK